MNPRDRKLRLRKNTVRDLSPQDASQVQGGVTNSWFWCPSQGILCPGSAYIPCPNPVPEPVETETCGCSVADCSAPCSNGEWSDCIAC